jgi:hypothetical protein
VVQQAGQLDGDGDLGTHPTGSWPGGGPRRPVSRTPVAPDRGRRSAARPSRCRPGR